MNVKQQMRLLCLAVAAIVGLMSCSKADEGFASDNTYMGVKEIFMNGQWMNGAAQEDDNSGQEARVSIINYETLRILDMPCVLVAGWYNQGSQVESVSGNPVTVVLEQMAFSEQTGIWKVRMPDYRFEAFAAGERQTFRLHFRDDCMMVVNFPQGLVNIILRVEAIDVDRAGENRSFPVEYELRYQAVSSDLQKGRY